MSWDPKNLKELIDHTSMTTETIALATGIKESVLSAYLDGCYAPTFDDLVKFSDYFAVPLDFIAGRLNREEYENIIKDYSRHFMELRRAPYESYIYGRNTLDDNIIDIKNFEAPYPYNLYESIIENPVDYNIREDYLEQAVATLNEINQNVIYLYYKDGLSLDDISEKCNISQIRTASILRISLRRLRHSSQINLIRNGWHSFEEIDKYADQKLSELIQREHRISELEMPLQNRIDTLFQVSNRYMHVLTSLKATQKQINSVIEDTEALLIQNPDVKMIPHYITIEELDLSVRSFSNLKRTGFKTLEDIINADLENLTKVGKKSLLEIVNKVHSMGYTFKDEEFLKTLEKEQQESEKSSQLS